MSVPEPKLSDINDTLRGLAQSIIDIKVAQNDLMSKANKPEPVDMPQRFADIVLEGSQQIAKLEEKITNLECQIALGEDQIDLRDNMISGLKAENRSLENKIQDLEYIIAQFQQQPDVGFDKYSSDTILELREIYTAMDTIFATCKKHTTYSAKKRDTQTSAQPSTQSSTQSRPPPSPHGKQLIAQKTTPTFSFGQPSSTQNISSTPMERSGSSTTPKHEVIPEVKHNASYATKQEDSYQASHQVVKYEPQPSYEVSYNAPNYGTNYNWDTTRKNEPGTMVNPQYQQNYPLSNYSGAAESNVPYYNGSYTNQVSNTVNYNTVNYNMNYSTPTTQTTARPFAYNPTVQETMRSIPQATSQYSAMQTTPYPSTYAQPTAYTQTIPEQHVTKKETLNAYKTDL